LAEGVALLTTHFRKEESMKITYDTATDSISCPELDPAQTAELQRLLSAALVKNEPVRTVASSIMVFVKAATTAGS
jgi:hypothetical protein